MKALSALLAAVLLFASLPASASTVRCLRGYPASSGGSAHYRTQGLWVEVIGTFDQNGKGVVVAMTWEGHALTSSEVQPARVRFDNGLQFKSEYDGKELLTVASDGHSGKWLGQRDVGCTIFR